jgi:two-component system, cell cycle response regulator DivK
LSLTPSARPAPLILIVDDFADALEIFGEYLAFAGYRTLTAASGFEALQIAREQKPNLILMDIRMVGMTGTQAMLALRQDAAFASTRIVALTAHAMDDERLMLLKAGFDEVITKPVFPDDLARRVEMFVGPPTSGTASTAVS